MNGRDDKTIWTSFAHLLQLSVRRGEHKFHPKALIKLKNEEIPFIIVVQSRCWAWQEFRH